MEAEAPASLTILGRPSLQRLPGVNLDDRLRLVPGFSLFRRSSSLVANPTTQGVSLRGLGSTGASRTLVLWDGIPLNDPFGGWVYWTRVAPENVERVEISRGASTSVFGDKALGGAITMFSQTPEAAHGTFAYEGGNQQTHQVSTTGSVPLAGKWFLSGFGRGFTTDGYYIVPGNVRGSVDTRANVRFAGGAARIDYEGEKDQFFLRFDALAEERDNGTNLQMNSTSLGTIGAQYVHEFSLGSLSLMGFHQREQFHATFSSIGTNRNSERLTSIQSVPAEASGGALTWKMGGSGWNTVVGADLNRAEGYSLDTSLTSGLKVGGGVQTQHGVYAQGDWGWKTLRFYGGLRRSMTGSREFWSPSAGAAWGVGNWRLRASGYRAFRAPTLNELYRDFRAGNVLTQANGGLLPERVTGVEAGADWHARKTAISLTLFRNDLNSLIVNVTRSVSPSLVLRQRDNAAAALSRGFEASLRQDWNHFRFDGSYLYAESRFSGGLRLPQVPKHQGSAILTWSSKRGTMVSGGVRAVGLQFEDDLNTFILPGFAAWHLGMSQNLNRRLAATAAFENLFNREFLTGYSPTPTIGAPRLWRLGLKWSFL